MATTGKVYNTEPDNQANRVQMFPDPRKWRNLAWPNNIGSSHKLNPKANKKG